MYNHDILRDRNCADVRIIMIWVSNTTRRPFKFTERVISLKSTPLLGFAAVTRPSIRKSRKNLLNSRRLADHMAVVHDSTDTPKSGDDLPTFSNTHTASTPQILFTTTQFLTGTHIWFASKWEPRAAVRDRSERETNDWDSLSHRNKL